MESLKMEKQARKIKTKISNSLQNSVLSTGNTQSEKFKITQFSSDNKSSSLGVDEASINHLEKASSFEV